MKGRLGGAKLSAVCIDTCIDTVHTRAMTTTKTLSPIYTIVLRDGETIGRVTNLGRTFRASRKTGTAEDMRRVSQGFRTVEAAVSWIEKA